MGGAIYNSGTLTLCNTIFVTNNAIAGSGQTAAVGSRYRQPLKARVLDSDGQPLEGATVTFTLGTGATGASASFLGGTAQATATTNANGEATSPPLVANASSGRFTAAAAAATGRPKSRRYRGLQDADR